MGTWLTQASRRTVAGLLGVLPLAAVSAQTPIGTELKLSGLVRPIFLTHAPNDFGRVFIIEKQGRIRIANITPSGSYTLLPTAFLDIDALVTGGTTEFSEQGLLGLAFHPNYPTNPRFYVNYTAVAGSGDTVVAEYTVSADPNIANTTGNTIMTFDQPQTNHNGGWIAFGPDDYLYIANGDGGNRDDTGTGHTEPNGNARDLTNNRLGKILRVDVNGDDFPADANRDYAIPPSNPFVGTGNDGEIWAWGLRNPWRNSFDKQTGDLWIADVGQDLWEEINFQPASSTGGEDYGWHCREGLIATNLPNTTCTGGWVNPIQVYSHNTGCSITGGYVYRGCAIPDLQGTYFYTDYCTDTIWSFRYNGTITEFTNRTAQLDPPGALNALSLSSFGQDAYGEVYLCDQVGGEIFKIIPTVPTTPDCNANGRNDACEILDGSVADANGNGVPDVCEGCVGDFDNNGIVDLADLTSFLSLFGLCTGDPGFNSAFDLDGNGCIDLGDLTIVLANFGCAP